MAWEKIQTEFGTVAKCQWTWRGVPDESFYSGATHHPIDDYIKKIKELASELYNTKKDLGEEQNKNKQLEKDNGELKKEKTQLGQDKANLTTELTNKDNDISQKDKTINNLQLKNEKLSESLKETSQSYKKLIQHLADARQLVVHLQKDLATEKQDKTHIQKELDDALVILNKPTTEIGTQTDLTAEQITQMEKLLYEGSQEIGRLEREMETIRTEQTQKETEINQLKEQVKNTKLNPNEERLMKMSIFSFYTKEVYQEWIVFLNSGKMKEEVWDWSQLTEPFKRLRNMMVINCQRFIELRDLEAETKEKEKTRQELQTKYDMEVRSKEELVEKLRLAKEYFSDTLYLEYNPHRLNILQKEIEIILQSFTPRKVFIRFAYGSGSWDLSFLKKYKKYGWNYFIFFLNQTTTTSKAIKVKLSSSTATVSDKAEISDWNIFVKDNVITSNPKIEGLKSEDIIEWVD